MSVLTKRKRGRPRLDESREINDFDASLIEAVKKYPIFYDKNHPHYRNRENTEHVWDLVADNLNVSVSIVKNRMFQLRNRYNVEKRRPATTWPMFERLQYLSEFGKNRNNRSLPAASNTAPGISSSDAEDEDDDQYGDGEELKQPPDNDASERNGYITNDNIDLVQHSNLLQSLQPAMEETNFEIPDDMENERYLKKFRAFGQFLASSLIELNEMQALHLVKKFTTDLVEYSKLEEGNKVSQAIIQNSMSGGEQEEDDHLEHN